MIATTGARDSVLRPDPAPGLDARPLRVVLVNYGHHREITRTADLLDRYETLTGWAEGLTSWGAHVVVVQGFGHHEVVERGGIRYEFVAGRFAPSLSPYRIPRGLHHAIRRQRPDVVHMNGLLYPLQAWALRRQLPRATVLVGQFHAEGRRRGVVGRAQRWGLRAFDGFLFTSAAQARPWRREGFIQTGQPVFEVVEGSTFFQRQDRPVARERSGWQGSPILLWVGNLNLNKDPMTVLAGFEGLLKRRPRARLYMVYAGSELLPRVQERLETRPRLSQAVTLVGAVPHAELEDLFNSADYFVLGSHHESAGYALIEALACGVVPVVSDIPSFRKVTRGGALGALWPPGDTGALGRALSEVVEKPLEPLSRSARRYFEEHLSYRAIGRDALTAYRALHWERSR